MATKYLILDDEQNENSSTKMDNNSNVVNNPVVAGTQKNIDLSVQGTEPMEHQTNEFILSDVLNKNKEIDSCVEDTNTTIDTLTSMISFIF